MVVEGQSISYSCDLGFEMDAGADNQLDCQSGGTLSGTLSSKNIQCNESGCSCFVYTENRNFSISYKLSDKRKFCS